MTNKGERFDLDGSGAVPLEEADPQRIGSIGLVGKLGSGGMGRVYLGVRDGRYAAVKQVLPLLAEDEAFLRHFGHELDNLSRLPAEATAPLLASDRDARPPWFATAYVPGLTLNEAVELHGGHLPADALWLLLREAAAGLKSVQDHEMVHRDLKPSNVMLTLDGVTLIDFGVARAVDQSRLTQTGMIVGTPAYMSPEQASGKRKLSGATDVFALGSLLAFAASGNPPFGDGAGLGTLYRIVHDAPDLDPVHNLDPELARVVASCLDKDPEGRPTAAELHELAVGQRASVAAGWPSAVAARLAERAAFAAATPRNEDAAAAAEDVRTTTLAAADGPAETVPAAPPARPAAASAPTPPTAPTAPRPARERRRKRLLLAVLPVLVVGGGTTLALQLLPYGSALHDNGRAAPSPSVSAQLHPTAPSSGAGHLKDPSGPATPGRQPQPAGTGGATGAAGPGDGQGASSGSRKDPGGGDAAGGTGGSAGPGGAATGQPPQPPAPGGYHQLKNAGNGRCLVETVYGNTPAVGDCTGDPSASWTHHQASGGTFTVVNRRTGDCLTAGMPGNNALSVTCGGAGQVWRTGSGGALYSVSNGQCLDIAFGGGVATAACETGKASQRWGTS
ncbi:serine/threonine protein kinase [Streptomyces lunalinharesii]|uniref:non-specific serine/threonine protein kinase n=1 Tax=Streptomyces lunalinharesii TaxID=333384 RepID=A0ABN3S354_9ACTN